jgi:hypothetical protein
VRILQNQSLIYSAVSQALILHKVCRFW